MHQSLKNAESRREHGCGHKEGSKRPPRPIKRQLIHGFEGIGGEVGGNATKEQRRLTCIGSQLQALRLVEVSRDPTHARAKSGFVRCGKQVIP